MSQDNIICGTFARASEPTNSDESLSELFERKTKPMFDEKIVNGTFARAAEFN